MAGQRHFHWLPTGNQYDVMMGECIENFQCAKKMPHPVDMLTIKKDFHGFEIIIQYRQAWLYRGLLQLRRIDLFQT